MDRTDPLDVARQVIVHELHYGDTFQDRHLERALDALRQAEAAPGVLTRIIGSLDHARSVCSEGVDGLPEESLANRLRFVAGALGEAVKSLGEVVSGITDQVDEPGRTGTDHGKTVEDVLGRLLDVLDDGVPRTNAVVGHLAYHVGYFDDGRPFVLPGVPSFHALDDCWRALGELQPQYIKTWTLCIMSRTLGRDGAVRWEVADGPPAPEWREIEEPLNWLVDEDVDGDDGDEDERGMTRLDLLRRFAVVVVMLTPSFCVIMTEAWSRPDVVGAVTIVACELHLGGLTCVGDEPAGWRDGTCSGDGVGELPLAQAEWVSPEKWTEKPRRAVVSTCRGTKFADGGR